MPIDITTPNSPGWWLNRLLARLADQRYRHDRLWSYYTGEAVIPALSSKACREAYQRLMHMARTNFAELVVEAVRERMVPVGIRTGADGDELGDSEAWRIYQANNLDANMPTVFRSSLAMGDAYMIVGGVDPDIGAPLITPEDPREVITEHDPRARRRVRAAVKVFTDDVDGTDLAYLYLPGFVFRAARQSSSVNEQTWDVSGWEWQGFDRLPAPVVPVVRFPNRADMFGRSKGEFEPHLPILDRINYGLLNRLEVATLQAFRQRALKGVPDKDKAGNPVDYDDIFSSDPGSMWLLPATAELWESGVVDLNPLRESNKDDVRDLSAVTRTPMYLFTPDAASGSAEGASLLREGLVFKTSDRIVQADDPLETVMSLAFLFDGDEKRANRRDMEILWRPPAMFSLSERADAAVKAQAAGVPWRSRMRNIWQSTPQEIERMEGELVADALREQGVADIAGLVNGAENTDRQPTPS